MNTLYRWYWQWRFNRILLVEAAHITAFGNHFSMQPESYRNYRYELERQKRYYGNKLWGVTVL